MTVGTPKGAVIALFSHDRAFRAKLDDALRAAGHRARIASRQAELAKALNSGEVRLLIVGPLAEDRAADSVCAGLVQRPPVVQNTTPDESIGEIVRRALALLPR